MQTGSKKKETKNMVQILESGMLLYRHWILFAAYIFRGWKMAWYKLFSQGMGTHASITTTNVHSVCYFELFCLPVRIA